MVKICKRIGFIYDRVKGDTGFHTPSMWVGGEWNCSCISYIVRGRCKHLKDLVRKMSPYDIDDVIGGKAGKKYDSSVDTLNELFQDSAYNSNEIVSLYGKPQIGKTLLGIQEACYFTSKGMNVLYIDTEGSLIPMVQKWAPVFEEKYGERKGDLIIESKRGLLDLTNFLGLDAELEPKGKGKLEFKVNSIKEGEIEKIVKKYDIDFIILDSLSSPLRRFTKQQQNFPARADATTFVMSKLVSLQEDYNMGCLVTNHASWNPTNPYETKAEVTGGVMVQYYTKRLVYLDRRKANAFSKYRRFYMVRGETSDDWSRATVSKIGEDGYVSVKDEDTIKEVFTVAESNKLDNVD